MALSAAWDAESRGRLWAFAVGREGQGTLPGDSTEPRPVRYAPPLPLSKYRGLYHRGALGFRSTHDFHLGLTHSLCLRAPAPTPTKRYPQHRDDSLRSEPGDALGACREHGLTRCLLMAGNCLLQPPCPWLPGSWCGSRCSCWGFSEPSQAQALGGQ